MARKRMFFEGAKAVRELGMPQTPIDRALAEAVDWFQAHGMAPGAGVRCSGVRCSGVRADVPNTEHRTPNT
jgi:hypothetical protein